MHHKNKITLLLFIFIFHIPHLSSKDDIEIISFPIIRNDSLLCTIKVINKFKYDTLLIPFLRWHIPSNHEYIDVCDAYDNYGGYNYIEILNHGTRVNKFDPLSRFCMLGGNFPSFVQLSPCDTFTIVYNQTLPNRFTRKNCTKFEKTITRVKIPSSMIDDDEFPPYDVDDGQVIKKNKIKKIDDD